MILNKIGDAYAKNSENREIIRKALEKGGLITAIDSETGLVIMDEVLEPVINNANEE